MMTRTAFTYRTRHEALADGWTPIGSDSRQVSDRCLVEAGALMVRADGLLSDMVMLTDEPRPGGGGTGVLVVLYPPAHEARYAADVIGGAA